MARQSLVDEILGGVVNAENWRKLAWITHTTKSSAWCASAGEVLAWAPM